ncbi:MAG TPA: ABC transporter ATP-binding protein [Burkholderiaceae bacterium]|nr:ABC transporter ATP-binding protein [Burkholderiaceae bacterium]
MATPTLEVDGLKTWFFTSAGVVKAVDGVSFSIAPGEVMGLVGESGSGKSITGFSIMGLIDPPGRVVDGRVLFKGEDLRQRAESQMRDLRGNRIAMIFQDPMMTLNPVLRVDVQMAEAVHAHRKVSRAQALDLACRALERVGIAAPEERLRAYPHQLSGGMRQRVAIAIALLNEPDLIIADEPTTALDVTIQGQILFEMQKICAASGTSLIWITHDLSVVAGLADQVGVMYAGRMVEHGTVHQVLESPKHPYTRGLIASVPSVELRGQRLRQIPGTMALPIDLKGCAFAPRCDRARRECGKDLPLEIAADGRRLRCCNPG